MSLSDGSEGPAGAAGSAMRSVRAVLHARRERPSGGDLAYRLYLAIMLVIIVVAPAVRGAILELADAWPTLSSSAPQAFPLIGSLLAALGALLALAGAHTGPARATLPEIDLLLTTALPRQRVIARGLWGSLLASAFAGLGVAGVLLASAALSGSDAGRMSLPLVSGGLGVGLILCAAMLLGQLGRSVRWSVAAVFAAAAAGLLISAADARAGTPEAAVTAAIAAILLAAGIVVTAAAPVLVGRLRWEALRDQSVRLSAVSGLALTGDMRMATARLGAPVSFGRRLRFAPTRRIALTLAIRDLLGLVRTPARSLAALLGVAVSGVVADAGIATGAALWAGLGGGAALLLAYASAGPWCRGLRSAAETIGSSPLLPSSPRGLLLAHLLVPLVLVLAVAGIAGGMPALVLGAFAVALRLLGAVKGTLPQRLLAPIPTPVGDMAGVNVLLWSLDGVIWALLLGAAFGALAAVSAIAAALFASAALLLLGIGSAVRLRAGSGVVRLE